LFALLINVLNAKLTEVTVKDYRRMLRNRLSTKNKQKFVEKNQKEFSVKMFT